MNKLKMLNRIYKDPANQPSTEYMRRLKEKQFRALRSANRFKVDGIRVTYFLDQKEVTHSESLGNEQEISVEKLLKLEEETFDKFWRLND